MVVDGAQLLSISNRDLRFEQGLGFLKTRFAGGANPLEDWPDFQIHLISGTPASDDGLQFRHAMNIGQKLWDEYYYHYVGKHAFAMYPVRPLPYQHRL